MDFAIQKSIGSLALRRLALRVAVAAAPLCACAAVLGIDDGHLRAGAEGGVEGGPGGGEGDAGQDANELLVGDGAIGDAVASDSSSGLGTLPDGAPIPSGCENVTADPTTGVFVDWKSGADSATCGTTPATPCQTVQQGINQAHNSVSTPNVYVADGTYWESITLEGNVNVYGGWTTGATAWTRECSQATTVIVAPPTAHTTVTLGSGTAKLSTLTIESKGAADVQPGESIFGIVATGETTTLALVFVTVTTASGGSGAGGAEGDAGITPPSACGDNAGDGGSPVGTGTKGTGADGGWFTASGYVATSGGPGGVGASGTNGTAGGPDTCVSCVTGCSGSVTSCSISGSTSTCGNPGQAGCGGGAGAGGAGGGGGGSSVALLAWDATINLTMTVLQAGGGGQGAGGGPGGPGGSGSPGMTGTDSPLCNTACDGVLGLGCNAGGPDAAGLGGHAGGPGGNGTSGGPGGDGSGGDAFAYVEGGNASVHADAFTKAAYSTGLPGGTADGGNGVPGRAGDQGP
jgi:hypothetical protein